MHKILGKYLELEFILRYLLYSLGKFYIDSTV